MTNLRFLESEGKMILQQSIVTDHSDHDGTKFSTSGWQDVPVHKEPETPKKPREFWLNIGKYPHGDYFYTTKESAEFRMIEHVKETIHAVELPQGSRVVSRDELIETAKKLNHLYAPEYMMKKICDMIGFEEK